MSFMLRMSEEQLAAHKRAAEKARLIQREENETETQADIRAGAIEMAEGYTDPRQAGEIA
jgi:hypothetical protein